MSTTTKTTVVDTTKEVRVPSLSSIDRTTKLGPVPTDIKVIKEERTTVEETKTSGEDIKNHLRGWPFWIFIIIAIIVLVITILLAKSESGWYNDLKKMSWAENMVVWAVLYCIVIILMAWCTSFAYCLADDTGKMYILTSFIAAIILIVITFVVFYRSKNLDVTFYLVMLLIAVSIFQTFVVWKYHAGSGIGMLPYVVFLIFVAGITYDISSKNSV
jgi:tryptophan-rich sensory protein